jgi:ATP-binding cassette, subfamily B, bacterial
MGWRLLRHTLRSQRRGLAAGIGVGLVWTVGKTASPLLVRNAIDRGITKRQGSLLVWALLLLAAGGIAAIFTGLRRFYAFRESRQAETYLRERLFAHLQKLHFAFHDASQTGNLMSRAASDLQQVQAFIVMIPMTVSNGAMVLASAVIMFTMHPLLALVALAPLPFVNVLARRFSHAIHPASMAIQRESGELSTVVEETISGIRIVKGFGVENRQRARLGKEADDVYGASMGAARVRSKFVPMNDSLPSIGLVLVLAYGGTLVLDGRLSIGKLVAFNAYVALLVWPIRNLGQIVALAQRAAAACERVHEVLATEPAIVDPPHPATLPKRSSGQVGRVELRDVTFGYGTANEVLSHFDLAINAGESIALVGATGSGKTTVARLLPRFYDVEQGSVCIDGIDVRSLRVRDLRRAVGIVFEDTFLFNDSVSANIAFAEPDAAPERIERAARLAGAHEFILELPDGYDTILGERGYSLSGGQRQRVAIARAILADPRVLILDDATSAVDPTKEHEIRDALDVVMRNRTTIVIAHRPATIAVADRVAFLDGGRVAAIGTHEELLATNERYREVLAAVDDDDAAPLDAEVR